MASLISENTQIWFSPTPTVSGTYRYDVLIDGEVVFVGNTYLEANQNPIIDITDIIKNFVDVNKPSFSAIAEKSSLIKDVEVTIYLDGEEYTQTTQKLMIYGNPFYKSYVTTPILDYFAKQDIETMPMLQGWDYINNKGYLLPTYPANQSTNITFDFICGYQSLPYIQLLGVEYGNNTHAESVVMSIAGNGIYQYSCTLNQLNKGVNNGNVFSNANEFSKYIPDEYSEIEWEASANGDNLELTPISTEFTSPTVIDKIYLRYENEDGSMWNQYTINNYSGEENHFKGSVAIGTSSYTIKRIIVEVMTMETLTGGGTHYWVSSTLNIDIDSSRFFPLMSGDIPRYSTNWVVDLKSDNSNGFIGSILFGANIETTYDEMGVPCDANYLNMVTFSPTNSNVRYDYRIANFDNQSRFFLKWKDRYGMPQCQPFGGNYKYSEDITQKTITNYKNTKKIIDINNAPKWTLNTKWIKQDLYPFYESIFVSPYLILYDAYEDKEYNVILKTTNYEEKTFKNQNRNLFNLQLEVELDTTENMIY